MDPEHLEYHPDPWGYVGEGGVAEKGGEVERRVVWWGRGNVKEVGCGKRVAAAWFCSTAMAAAT